MLFWSTGNGEDGSQMYQVLSAIIHPNYDKIRNTNDIGIVTVKGIINFSDHVGPACLPFQHQFDSFGGSYVTILGRRKSCVCFKIVFFFIHHFIFYFRLGNYRIRRSKI